MNLAKCKVAIEERVYGRREPFKTIFGKCPKIWARLGKYPWVEKFTRGELKDFRVTEGQDGNY